MTGDGFETDWPVFDVLEDINVHGLTNSNTLSYMVLNVRSLRNKFNILETKLNSLKRKVSFLVFTEIWLNSDEVNLYKLIGYNLYSKCNDNYAAGGVIVYVDDEIQDIGLVEYEMKSADCLILNVRLGNLIFSLVALYRLHKFTKEEFLIEFNCLLAIVKSNCFILGDFNLNLLCSDSHVQHFTDLLSNHSFVPLVNQCTHVGNNSNSCIDNVIVRYRDLNVFDIKIVKMGLSDHYLINLDFKYCQSKSGNNSLVNHRSYISYIDIKEQLVNVSWGSLYECQDVDRCTDLFYDVLNKCILSNTKSRVMSNKLVKAKNKSPWITENILKKLKKRDYLYKSMLKKPYDMRLKNYFINFQNKLSHEIDEKKNAFYRNLFNSYQGNARQQWRVINRMTGGNEKGEIRKVVLDNGEVVENGELICDVINDYFINVANQLSSGEITVHANIQSHCLNSFFISATNEDEIVSTILKLKNKKSCGVDNISVELIKFVAVEIASPLKHIFNLSFSTGIFPSRFKNSIVIPLLKKTNVFKIDNLRPISLLPTFAKLLEKLMKKRLLQFLDAHKFFNISQFGFTKGRSTEDALSMFVERVYNSINSNKKTTSIFVDFRKAFDMVDKSILLYKLEMAGIRGVANKWFNSYLCERTQIVKINNKFSQARSVNRGVPQGSVLSATLFIIFINDLLNTAFNGQAVAFADDFCLIYSNNNYEAIYDHLNDDLLKLRDWCIDNDMVINVKKTNYINFDMKGRDFVNGVKFHDVQCNSFINCGCGIIEKVDSYKYLGVTLDEKMSWEKHISVIYSVIKKSIRTFYYLRNRCDLGMMRQLYFALIHSRINYGIQCWGGSFKNQIDKIRKIQNQFIRLILYKNRRESSFPLFKQLQILPVQHQFVFKVLRDFFKRSGNSDNDNIYDHGYETRSYDRNAFRRPKIKKSCFQRSFIYMGPTCFNVLPTNIKQNKNLRSFCRLLKNWLFNMETTDCFCHILR